MELPERPGALPGRRLARDVRYVMLAAMPEPDIVVRHREQLIYLLAEAAEIEHGLMCCYLYAAMSLKRDGLTPDQQALVDGWRKTINVVAREEMLHLALVNNILVAVGAGAHFLRLNMPVSPGIHPAGIVVELSPFDAATLDHLIYLERPEGLELPDGEGFVAGRYERPARADRLMASAQDYATVGHFYRGLAGALRELSARIGEADLFCGDPKLQVTQDLFPLPGLVRVKCLKTALAAIERIVEQGEGSAASSTDSHYNRFLAVKQQLVAATTADATFLPAHPAARNPLMRKPVDSRQRVFIEDPDSARVLDLANAIYGHSLRLLQRCYAPLGDSDRLRAELARSSMELMRLTTPIGERLATMPAGPAHPGTNAGVSFAISRSIDPFVDSHAAWVVLLERVRELAAGSRALASLDGVFGDVGAAIDKMGDRLAALSSEAGVAIVVAPVTPAPVSAHASEATTTADGVEEVQGDRLVLRFEGKRCIHSRHCVLNAPEVFLANVQGPWIHPNAIPVSEVVAVAHMCPSGAITYERKDGEPNEQVPRVNSLRIRENGPLALSADVRIAGKNPCIRATLCRCGASKNKPYCDGSHNAIGFQASGEPATTAPDPLAARGGPLTIEAMANGPLIVSGNVEMCANTGRIVARVTSSRLCRCGGSANKPFCDGTHARNGFEAAAVE
jgi:CDGSH-type Zn-finger protein/uncharacterized Fe-S cluster protein YjdI